MTPFREDGSVDLEAVPLALRVPARERLRRCRRHGATGESRPSPTTSGCRALRGGRRLGRRPRHGDRGHGRTRPHTRSTSPQAHAIGVDGFLVVTPYYNKPPQRASSPTSRPSRPTDRPVVFYRHPPAGGRRRGARDVSRLAEIENVRAVKQAKPSLDAARHVVSCGLDLYAGDDDLVLPFLEVGGLGGICVATRTSSGVGSRRWSPHPLRRRRAGAALDRRELRPAIEILRVQTNPIAIKEALASSAWRSAASGSRSSRPTRRRPADLSRAARARRRARRVAPRFRRRAPSVDSVRERPPDHPPRRPRRGRQEHDRVRVRRRADRGRRGARVPPRRALRRRPRPARLLVPGERRAAARDRAHARPRGSRRRAALPAAGGRVGRGARHAADARARQVEARRAQARLRDRAHRGRAGRPADGRSGLSGSSSCAWRIRSRTRWRWCSRRPPGACSTPATRSSTTRRSTASRPDVGALAELGDRGVDLLLGDSTNAERPGLTGSERLVGEAFRQLIPLRTGRIVVASFASNIHRVQQAAEVAIANGRKVAVVGRSMRKNMNIARNLGYVDLPDDAIVSPKEAMDAPRPDEVLILCTGSQGEPMSALTRIAYGDHPNIEVDRGDTVIISAKPVPGNELRVHDSINRLARLGAEVLHQEIAPVHVSGHACSRGAAHDHLAAAAAGRCRSTASTACSRPTPGWRARPASATRTSCSARTAPSSSSRADGAADRRSHRGGRHVRRRPRGRRRRGRRAPRPPPAVRGRCADHRATVASHRRRRQPRSPPELIARGVGEDAEADRRSPRRGGRISSGLHRNGVTEIKLLQEHLHDGIGQVDLRANPAPPHDPAGGDRGPMGRADDRLGGRDRGERLHAGQRPAARGQLRACEAAAIAFCRLLERWGRGDAVPATPGAPRAAFRHAADRVETALAGLEAPLGRYLLELEPDRAEGRSWYGGPGVGRAARVGARCSSAQA